MRIYRLVVDLELEVRTYVVAARDHRHAWRVLLGELSAQERSRVALEELEAGEPLRGLGPGRVLRRWPGGGLPVAPSGNSAA